MLLKPFLDRYRNLTLDAFSYSDEEINSVRIVLQNAGIHYDSKLIKNDRDDRKGISYFIHSQLVSTLEKYLNVIFRGTEKDTFVDIVNEGIPFKCDKISISPNDKECITILANGLPEARTKCSLLANNNGWFGGVASPGKCS